MDVVVVWENRLWSVGTGVNDELDDDKAYLSWCLLLWWLSPSEARAFGVSPAGDK